MSPVLEEETIDSFLAGESDTLEGQDDTLSVWKAFAQSPASKTNYHKAIVAFRALEQCGPERRFSDAEQDALWSMVWAGVTADAKRRSGLSKQALRHLTIPSLVKSIVAALDNANLQRADALGEVVVEVDVNQADTTQEVEVSIASIGGELSLRVHRDEELDVHVGVTADGTPSKSSPEVDNWQAVSSALQELSKRTTELLGADALVNCRVSISNGKAEVHLRPLHVGTAQTKK